MQCYMNAGGSTCGTMAQTARGLEEKAAIYPTRLDAGTIWTVTISDVWAQVELTVPPKSAEGGNHEMHVL